MSMYLFAVISVPWVPEQEAKEEERGKGIGKENGKGMGIKLSSRAPSLSASA